LLEILPRPDDKAKQSVEILKESEALIKTAIRARESTVYFSGGRKPEAMKASAYRK
jgi:hypothetical protein